VEEETMDNGWGAFLHLGLEFSDKILASLTKSTVECINLKITPSQIQGIRQISKMLILKGADCSNTKVKYESSCNCGNPFHYNLVNDGLLKSIISNCAITQQALDNRVSQAEVKTLASFIQQKIPTHLREQAYQKATSVSQNILYSINISAAELIKLLSSESDECIPIDIRSFHKFLPLVFSLAILTEAFKKSEILHEGSLRPGSEGTTTLFCNT
jgi:hypothetical protein